MTAKEVPERDWKIFRGLREEVLEAFSQQILDEIVAICSEGSRGAHERYGEIHRLLRERDKSMAEAFDYLSRSRMLMHLAAMRNLGLLRPEDLKDMSPETQARVRILAEGPLG